MGYEDGVASPSVGPEQSPERGCKEVSMKCVLWFIFFVLFFDHIFIDYIFITKHVFCDFMFNYSAATVFVLLVLLIYWELNGVAYIIMVRKQDVFSLIIRSEIVLGCIFVLECLLWNIVCKTELGKRFASLGCEGVV